ncbi:MAG: aminoglycoside phosphotransferase family protein [Chloroflexi bacterium]|nr:aminoglycoside phosphotransferase family protein [Chloroflexota bacterium]
MPREAILILPNPETTRVLTQQGRLPRVTTQAAAYWQDVSWINAALGDHVATLRCLSVLDEDLAAYVLTLRTSTWRPPRGYTWTQPLDVDPLPDADLIAAWLAWENQTQRNPSEPHWYRPEWFDSAEAWIEEALLENDLAAFSPITQQRAWQRSCVLAVDTNRGMHYFKAVPPMFAHEVRLSNSLHALFPQHCPKPLAADPVRRWLLQADFGGRVLFTCTDPAIWEDALCAYAGLQIKLAERLDLLANLGVPLRGERAIHDGLGALVLDRDALQTGAVGLSDDEITDLQNSLGVRQAALADLFAGPLPLTLDHGDFHSGNVMIHDDDVIFFDWSDSSITHPFFSLPFFMAEIHRELPGVDRQRLIEAYLRPWSDFAPLPELRDLYDLAAQLAGLHGALYLYDRVLPGMFAPWEEASMLPYYLRMSMED